MEKIVPFYTPIWRFTSPMNTDAYLKKCLDMKSDNGVIFSNVGGYQSHKILKNDFKNSFYEIYNFIEECINVVGEDTKSTYELNTAWVNINNKNNYNINHVHPHSSISGCIYLKTNPNCGRIVFENPTPSVHYNINDNVDGFFGTYWYNPGVGDLIVFPSYLAHYVEPNNSEDVRVSISFNCDRISYENNN